MKELPAFDDWFSQNRNYFVIAHGTKDDDELRKHARAAYSIVEEVNRNPNAYAKKTKKKKSTRRKR